MRKVLVVLSVTLVVLAGVPAALAKGPGPNNSWTQLQNTYVPGQSGSPYCNPCVRWVIGSSYHSGYWSYHVGGSSLYHTRTRSAVADWGAQQYRSPVFTEHNGTCTSDDVCVTAAYLDPRYCGWAVVHNNTSGYIDHATVELTSNGARPYVDGPPAPKSSQCDLAWTMHHEVGHAYSEGHSGVYNDLMNPNQTLAPREKVDADAQAELRAVYGIYHPACPCPSLNDLKLKMAQLAASLDTIPESLAQLEQPTAA